MFESYFHTFLCMLKVFLSYCLKLRDCLTVIQVLISTVFTLCVLLKMSKLIHGGGKHVSVS